MRSRRLAAALAAFALLAAGCGSGKREAVPLCTTGDVVLTLEQAANAATIAAVGKRLGLPDHAVTVALATALQESGLHNLSYGDRDSLGLFQQRPSQGWGSAQTIRTPRLAAASFYRHLRRVPGWAQLPVTEAAQHVQHSAAPAAYAQWEQSARELARALTGEAPAGLSCRYRPVPHPDRSRAGLQAQAVLELGPGGLDRAGSPAVAWATASWLVAHAAPYGISSVRVSGHVWTAVRGSWRADPGATALTWV
ncbi:MAG: hypothetical protein WCD35_01845 [Mycobacteriales bacterium]